MSKTVTFKISGLDVMVIVDKKDPTNPEARHIELNLIDSMGNDSYYFNEEEFEEFREVINKIKI